MSLRKSLHGIYQTPANWHGTIVDFVITTGFKPLKSDPCIYIYNLKTKKGPTFASWNKDTVILTIYVQLPRRQHRFRNNIQESGLQADSALRRQLGQQPGQRQVNVILRHDDAQRAGELQSG